MTIFYFGSLSGTGREYENRLESFTYPKKCKQALQEHGSILIDCGAFSAFKTGKPIEEDKYIEFINKNRYRIDGAFSIDDLQFDPDKTYNNLKRIEDKGCSVIPVFHIHTDLKYLHKLLIDGYDYIALGGYFPLNGNQKLIRKYLDLCFDLICDNSGKPLIKIHGFAFGSRKLMQNYPFYSVDSTSWTFGNRAGQLYVEGLCYDSVFISHGYINNTSHISRLSQENINKLHKILEDDGLSIDILLGNPQLINDYNIKTFKNWAKNATIIYDRNHIQYGLF